MRPGILWLVKLDTSFGEASSRTQATDPNRRETLRIRTPLPGLRGEAKWLRRRTAPGDRAAPARRTVRAVPRYAVECQSSNERGAGPGSLGRATPGRCDDAARLPARAHPGAACRAPG